MFVGRWIAAGDLSMYVLVFLVRRQERRSPVAEEASDARRLKAATDQMIERAVPASFTANASKPPQRNNDRCHRGKQPEPGRMHL